MLAVWNKLRWSLTQRGLLGTLKAVPKALTRGKPVTTQHPFDQRYGTDTSGLIGGGSLAIGHAHDVYITGYSGIPPSRFEGAIDHWKSTLGRARIEDYTFIDLGCGKGRAVLLASRLPFREVVGIELNPQLAAIALHNAEHWQHIGEAQTPIRVEVGDATEPVLASGPTLLFLYNAFAEPLVHHLAENISRSRRDRVDLIFQNADSAHAFTPQLGFRELWRGSLPLSPDDASSDPVASNCDATVIFRLDAKSESSV
jgi:SAM-dependent methyltransferase